MGIYDLFSKRLSRSRGEAPDVYTYDNLPRPLRVQIVTIVDDAFGEDQYGYSNVAQAYKDVHDIICRERGVFHLSDNPRREEPKSAVINDFLAMQRVELALDFVEVSFRIIDRYIRDNTTYLHLSMRKLNPDEAIEELNARFKEHGVGYQYVSFEIIRVDSEFLHSNAVKPALQLLAPKRYKGANDEFLAAHEHFRHNRHKECLNDALKAFESTMKIICAKRKWTHGPNDTSKALIEVCLSNGLIPSYLTSQFTSLRSLLESGTATIRNKAGGHGQGTSLQVVPEFLAAYSLHLTASTILFLIRAEEALP